MNDNRLQVLRMLDAGQVSAEEADRLIAALDRQAIVPAARTVEVAASTPRYLRIFVDEQGSDGDGPTKVNIRVPFQLLRAGVRLASLIPNNAKDQINEALNKNGVPIDVTQLKPEDLDELVLHLADLTIDVEEKDTKVRIFAE
jgi:polyhydroxyalkanoate synthesis regulator phasin